MDTKYQDIQIVYNKAKCINQPIPFFCVRQCELGSIYFSEKYVTISYTESNGINHEIQFPKEMLKGHKIIID